MTTEEKIVKAKVQLILDQPFFATLALRLKYVADPLIKRALTNGKQIRYNPAFIEKLTVDEVKGLIAHEVLHIALLHHTRRNNRDKTKWNRAADFAINPMLMAAMFIIPENSLLDPSYKNKSAEQIYELLPEHDDEKGKPNGSNSPNDILQTDQDDSGSFGDVEDAPPEDNLQEIESQVKQMLAQAAMIAKGQGKLSPDLERMVTETLEPQIDWREVLARFVTEITSNDYTWSNPSIRYLHSGLYLPSLKTEETGTIILIADTSISIDRKLINQFAGEAQDIATTFNTLLQVIYVDEKVQAVQDIDPGEPIHLEPKGGGGTDFRPGFHYIEEHELQPKAVVYLTDGECHSFPDEPDYPVLWAQFGDYEFSPPFGEVVHVA